MKRFKIVMLALISVLVLSGCGVNPLEPPPTTPTPVPTVAPTQAPPTQAPVAPTAAPAATAKPAASQQPTPATRNVPVPSREAFTPPSGGVVLRRPNEGFNTPYVPPSTQPDPVQARRAHLGTNVWAGEQIDLTALPALKENEAYITHGDVEGKGNCKVYYWTSGKPTRPPLSAATWQLYHVQGVSQETLDDAAAVAQIIASFGDLQKCMVEKK